MWQSMKSAPRDGTTILLRTKLGAVSGWYAPGEWTEDYFDGRDYTPPVWVCHDDAFQIEIDQFMDEELSEATAWMPMPPASPNLNQILREEIAAAPDRPDYALRAAIRALVRWCEGLKSRRDWVAINDGLDAYNVEEFDTLVTCAVLRSTFSIRSHLDDWEYLLDVALDWSDSQGLNTEDLFVGLRPDVV